MSNKHNIIICSNAYPPNFIGGAEIIAHNQAKALIAKGHNVVVFAGDTYSNKKQYEVYRESFEGIEVYRISLNAENFDNNFVNFKNKQIEKAFLKIVDIYNPDVVHCHNIIGLSLGIIDIAKNIGLKTVITLHDHWGYCYKNTILKDEGKLCDDFTKCEECMKYITGGEVQIPMKFRKYYFKYILNKVDVFISPSKYLAESYIKGGIPKEKMNVIWNGIDVEKYKKVVKKPSKKIRFTFVGYFGKHKGVITMLKALTHVRNKDFIEINLVGEGEEKAEYIHFAKKHDIINNIRFWGKVPNSEIQNVYAETDVYFIASIWPENQPVSITEALICGIPVIASNLGGNTELIINKKDGLLFKAGDALDLAEKIDYFIENRNLIDEYGKNGKEKMDRFSFTSQVDKILEKYNEKSIVLKSNRHLKIAFLGKKISDNILNKINYDSEIFMLDWINEFNFDDLDVVIILPNNNTPLGLIKKLMSHKIVLIVHEIDSILKDLMIKANCGIYYVNEENIHKYLEYLIENTTDRKALSSNAYEYITSNPKF